MINKEQVETIRNELELSKISIESLREDLLDHICCLTEDKMAKGIAFDKAWKEAVKDLAPEGLYTIEKETIDILKSPNLIFMKKLMYVLGLVSAIAMSMGFMLKILHMPGGEELLNFGFLTFILLFLPLQAWDRFKSSMLNTTQEKWRFVLGCVSALAVALAVIFKIVQLLPAAEFFLMLGVSVFSFGFLPLLFYNLYRKSVLHS